MAISRLPRVSTAFSELQSRLVITRDADERRAPPSATTFRAVLAAPPGTDRRPLKRTMGAGRFRENPDESPSGCSFQHEVADNQDGLVRKTNEADSRLEGTRPLDSTSTARVSRVEGSDSVSDRLRPIRKGSDTVSDPFSRQRF